MLKAKAAATWAKIVADAETVGEQPHHALALPALRPYLADKRTLKRLCAGFAALLLGLLRLLQKGLRVAFAAPVKEPPPKAEPPAKGEKPSAEKAKEPEKGTPTADAAEQAASGVLIVVLAGTVAVTAATSLGARLLPYLPIITGIAIPGLLIAAWIAAPTPAPKPPAQPSAEARVERERIILLHLLEEATRGRNGAHLAHVHEQTSGHPLFGGVERARIGAMLEAYGVPVERSLSVGGIDGRSGVRRTVVEALIAAIPRPETVPHSRTSESAPDLHESRPALGPLSADSRAALGPADALPAP